ncbi:O-phospho-L-seryl-tRNA:Cys-tRNA synthase [Candidatus Methanobinarius endosymbioticus]|uniref:O-phospho-L-seryl-tRNA:Cys-tRNA synthase n=1 Tax=Candidatus Methanobinarius endosymbioticus TaxID=2006182 RepID=A0A366MAM6_9EURY|nr:O-phospho-L-seryl-tRNA:Cys-tRNA synthase [Candidatus Methanobinarius endosymbioticus]
MECQNYNISRDVERENLNLNPLQRGGILPKEARKALHDFGDGYSVCDYCGGRLDEIAKPSLSGFLEDLAKFLQVDDVRTTHGARESKFAVMHGICEPADVIVVDGNAHYTTHLAAERNKLEIVEVPSSGYPEFKIDMNQYKKTLENAIDEYGEIKLALLTHIDGNYGNLSDASEFGKICSKLGVPSLLNCAYSMGRLPIESNKWNLDFVVGSGHKSMAASGPIGVLGMKHEWGETMLKRSPRHVKKEVEMLGCTSRGAPIATLMASLPHVIERVNKWNEEVNLSRNFVSQLEEIDGITQIGIKPTNHDLVRFDTPILHEISKFHPRKGFFLYEELKSRKIVGIKRGQTEWFKCSTYGMTKNQRDYIVDSFKEIVEKFNK